MADIKPLEFPYSFVMEMAWNRSVLDFGTIPTYAKAFAALEFEGSGLEQEQFDEIAAILLEQSRLIRRRKFEST